MSSYCTVGCCGNHLAKLLGTHVTDSVYSGNVRLTVLACNNIPCLVKGDGVTEELGSRLSADADEDSVTLDSALLTAFHILGHNRV